MDPQQLFIYSLEIRNFKSVKEALLNLSKHGRLIAMCGANGAGKTVCLEAIAFACGAPASHLRVHQLADLVKGNKEPAVVIKWRSLIGKELVLATTFKQQKDRVFKMNGKLATKAAVHRTLLKEHIYSEHSFVRQAQVATLVQNSSGNALAAVIHEVSGGAHQQEAARQATTCLAWMKTQIAQVRLTVAGIAARVSNDSGALEAEEGRLKAGLARVTAAQTLIESCSDLSALIDDELGLWETNLDDLKKQLSSSEADLKALLHNRASGSVDTKGAAESLKAKELDLAAAHSGAAAAQAELKQLHCLQEGLIRSAACCDSLGCSLGSLQERLAQQKALHQSIRGAIFSGRRRVALDGFQRDLCTAQTDVCQLDSAINCAKGRLESSACTVSDAKGRAETLIHESAHRPSLQQVKQEQQKAAAFTSSARQALQAAQAASCAASAQLLSQCPQVPSTSAQPLVTAFTFKSSTMATVQQCSVALSLLMGSLMEVLLVPRMADVQSLITRHGKRARLRVWPLDSIAFSDRSALFRRIAKDYPEGAVVYPVDLIEFQARHAPAVHRMFGHTLIAVNDRVAADLVHRHGVACITRSGTRHMRGALEGGWRPQAATSACELKLSSQQADDDLLAAQAQHRECQSAQEEAAGALMAMEREDAALTRAQVDLQSAEAQVGIHKRELQKLLQDRAVAIQRAHDLQALVAAQSNVHDGSDSLGNEMGTDALKLQDAEQLAAVRIKELQDEVNTAEAELEAAKEQQQELQLQIESMDVEAIEAARAAADSCEAECLSAVAACKERLESLQQGDSGAADKCTAVQAKMQEVQAAMSQCTDELQSLRLEQKQVRQERQHAAQVCVPLSGTDSDAVEHTRLEDAGLATGIDRCRSKYQEHLQEFREATKCFNAAQKADHCKEVSAQERQVFAERSKALAKLREQLTMLENAAGALDEDIQQSTAMALHMGDQVYQRIAAAFRLSMSEAIPQLEFDLQLQGSRAADGVHVIFREHRRGIHEISQDAEAGAGWSTNLDELSTGQRSLCALAYLLAAAGAGIKPALLLVDEVDAALDGVNQGRVGKLLHHAGAALSCQVWAVSHSATFQQFCDTFVHVSNGTGGTTVDVQGQARACNKKRKIS